MLTLESLKAVLTSSFLRSQGENIYSYDVARAKWAALTTSAYTNFTLSVFDNKVVVIGGSVFRFGSMLGTDGIQFLSPLANSLKTDKKTLPPMGAKRILPAAVSTLTHRMVAGGQGFSPSTIEVLDNRTHHWGTASASFTGLQNPRMTLCEGNVYLLQDYKFFSISLESLLDSCKRKTSLEKSNTWSTLAHIPVQYGAGLVTLKGQVLAVGGAENGSVYAYVKRINQWRLIGKMPSPRYDSLVVVLPSNEMVVVGGQERKKGMTYDTAGNLTEIAWCQ